MNYCSESIQPQCVWACLTDKYAEYHIFWLPSDHPSQEMNEASPPTVRKWWFLTHSLLEQIWHFLLPKPSSQLFGPDTIQDDTSDQKVTSCHPKTWGPYLVHCHALTSMSYLIMTPEYYWLDISAGFWQQHWVLHLICYCWPLNPSPQLLIFLHHQWMDLTLLCCCMTSSILALLVTNW